MASPQRTLYQQVCGVYASRHAEQVANVVAGVVREVRTYAHTPRKEVKVDCPGDCFADVAQALVQEHGWPHGRISQGTRRSYVHTGPGDYEDCEEETIVVTWV